MSSKKNEITFEVRVTPRSSKNEVHIEEGGIKIFLHTIPEDGKANRECINLLSDFFSVPKSDITLTRGMKSRNKIFSIRNISSEKTALLLLNEKSKPSDTKS